MDQLTQILFLPDLLKYLINKGKLQQNYNNKKLKSEGEYQDDKMVGTWKIWHWNGQISAEGEYLNGRKKGLWTTYDEVGEIIERKTH